MSAAAAGAAERRPIRVLFVCTHNSARSQMAEVLLRQRGGDAFEVHSAGTEVRDVNPLTLRVLREAGLDTSGLRSKSVAEYLGQQFHYVVTVCDEARQVCPVFPGGGTSMHWGYEDPSATIGTDEERLAVFQRVFARIAERIDRFVPAALGEHARHATPGSQPVLPGSGG